MSVINSILLYASVMLWAGIFLYLAKIESKKDNKIWRYGFIILGTLPMFFIMAFRYDVGTDTSHYIDDFQIIANGNIVFAHEYGFYILNKMILLFTNQSQWLIIVTSFIFLAFFIKTVEEESTNPFLSIVILFGTTLFFVELNNIRQQIAVVMLLWGYRFVKNNNLWAYIGVCVTAAFFFHLSSIMMIFVYPLVNTKLLQKWYFIWMPILVCALPLIIFIYGKVYELLGYDGYLDWTPSGNNNLLYLNLTFLFILFIGYGFKNIRNDKNLYGYFALQFVTIIITLIGFYVTTGEINTRICFYFMIFQVLSLPKAVNLIKENSKVLAILSLLLISVVLVGSFYYSIYLYGYHEVLPYQFCFSHWEELKVILPENKALMEMLSYVGNCYNLFF